MFMQTPIIQILYLPVPILRWFNQRSLALRVGDHPAANFNEILMATSGFTKLMGLYAFFRKGAHFTLAGMYLRDSLRLFPARAA